jgi:hypothetical protein
VRRRQIQFALEVIHSEFSPCFCCETTKRRHEMKATIEAQAEPEWNESHEDPAFGLANETEWMKRAEIRVMAESGIDTSEIQWIEWEVTGYEEARWTIEAPEATIKAILEAGWQQAAA